MSREQFDPLPPWAVARLEALRRQLEAGEWPAGLDRLREDLAGSRAAVLTDNEADMLTVVVNDALEGIDIKKQYPAFYQQMLDEPRLYHAFLEALSALEVEGREIEEPHPETEPIDLSFLERVRTLAPAISKVSGGWRLVWRREAANLHELLVLAFRGPLGVERATRSFLEDDHLALLNTRVDEADQMEILLEGVRMPDNPNRLQLHLFVSATPLPERLQATLKWGDYEATVPVEGGHAELPALLLADVLDETGQLVREDLELTLEPPDLS